MLAGEFNAFRGLVLGGRRDIQKRTACRYGVRREGEDDQRHAPGDKKPGQVWHKKDPFCSPDRIQFYKQQFKRESAGTHGFEYTYIDRMVNYEGFDQLKWMSEQLKNYRYESKRIQAITWMPKVDWTEQEDQPCFQRIWVFPHKNHRLDVHIHYRSWDMFKAFEANLMAFQELVKDELIGPTDFSLGTLRCIGDNVHIYEDDFQSVEQVLKK